MTLSIFIYKYRLYILLFSIIIILYAWSLTFNYVYLDDHALILNRADFFSEWKNIGKIFSQDIFYSPSGLGHYYRPLYTLSLMLNAQIYGVGSLFFFHLINIFFHILAVGLFVYLLKQLGASKISSFMIGLVFAIHPAMTQVVSLVTARGDSLLAIFILLGVISFIKLIKTNKFYWFIIIGLSYALALFTKEAALVFPLSIFVYLVLYKPKTFRTHYVTYLYLLIMLVIITTGYMFIRQAVLQIGFISEKQTMVSSFVLGLPTIIAYIGKIMIPIDISPLQALPDLNFIYGAIGAGLLFILILFSQEKHKNSIIFGAIWFFIFIIPSMLYLTTTSQMSTINRLYLPAMGIGILISNIKLPYTITGNKLLKTSLLSIILFTLVVLNLDSQKDYQNRLVFWQSAVKGSPSNAFSRNNLGSMYYLDGNFLNAQEHWEEALFINPYQPLVNYNLGLLAEDRHDIEAAQQWYYQELQVNPLESRAAYNLTKIYLDKGEKQRARTVLENALAIYPSHKGLQELYDIISQEFIENND